MFILVGGKKEISWGKIYPKTKLALMKAIFGFAWAVAVVIEAMMPLLKQKTGD